LQLEEKQTKKAVWRSMGLVDTVEGVKKVVFAENCVSHEQALAAVDDWETANVGTRVLEVNVFRAEGG